MAFSFLYLTAFPVSLNRNLNCFYQTRANLHLTVPLYLQIAYVYLSEPAAQPAQTTRQVNIQNLKGPTLHLRMGPPPCHKWELAV